jgi:L-alanine-DL-glutamate epimerase-like enolase superfamily enzyme
MKITDVKTVLLTRPIGSDPWIGGVRPCRSNSFIEIYTDQGLVGIQETSLGYFPDAHLASYVVSPLVASYNGISGFVKGTALFVENNQGGGLRLASTKPGLGITLTEKTKAKFPFAAGSGEFTSVLGKVLEGPTNIKS